MFLFIDHFSIFSSFIYIAPTYLRSSQRISCLRRYLNLSELGVTLKIWGETAKGKRNHGNLFLENDQRVIQS